MRKWRQLWAGRCAVYQVRRMKHALLAALCVALLCACGGANPEEEAAKAAKGYYDLLLEGRYDEFVAGKIHTDSIPANYREQLVANMKMFVGQMQKEHNGMKEIRVANSIADAERHTVNAFLVICFGDSTMEETVVPMVEHQGKWLMK